MQQNEMKYLGVKNGERLREFDTLMEAECMEYLFNQLKEMVFKDKGSVPIQKTLDEIDRTAARGMLETMQAGAMAKKFAQYMQEE